jgi:hypothetical protein
MNKIKKIPENIQYAYYEGLHRIQELARNIKYAYQRARYGYDDRMVQDFKYYYSVIATKILTRFKDETMGYPYGMRKDDWLKALQQMIDGFDAAVRICEDIGNESPHRKKDEEIRRRGMRMFMKHYMSLWE